MLLYLYSDSILGEGENKMYSAMVTWTTKNPTSSGSCHCMPEETCARQDMWPEGFPWHATASNLGSILFLSQCDSQLLHPRVDRPHTNTL